MNKITIKSISLRNFMGFVESDIDFDPNKNVLYGKSGCGKSTIKNAWLWVCGIDVPSPFPSLNNKVIPDLETRVICRISIGENEHTLRRTGKQLWKRTEDGERHFNGFSSSDYSFDGVCMNSTTYRNRLCSVFGIEKYEYLKFLCDTEYFNTGLDIKKRREILFSIGNVSAKTAELKLEEKYKPIISDLDKGLSASDIVKLLNTSDKQISAEKKENLTRIEERSADLLIKYDFNALREKQRALEEQYRAKRIELDNLSKQAEIVATKQKILELQDSMGMAILQDKQRKQLIENGVQNTLASIGSLKAGLESSFDILSAEEQALERITNMEYCAELCPVCKQPIHNGLSDEEQQKLFEKNKLLAIKEKQELIKAKKKTMDSIKVEYEALLVKYNDLLEQRDNFKPNPLIGEYQEKIDVANEELEGLNDPSREKQINFELQTIEQDLRIVAGQLSLEKVRESADLRIRQLEKANLELAKLEKDNYIKRLAVEDFIMSTIRIVNDSINGLFEGVRWNLFDTYSDKAEKTFKEDCEAIFDDRLFHQLSTGQKLMANYYTTLGLQKAFGLSLPIFFDESQSSTFERKCEQQLIELVTSTKESNIVGKKISNEENK